MCIYIFKACVQLYVYSHISKYILEYIYQHTRHCFIKMGAMFYVVCCTMILSLTNTLWKSLWVIWWKPNSYFYWLGNILLCEWSNFQSIVFLWRGFPSGSEVKNMPAKQETEVWSWVGKIPGRREQLPTPVFLPGESQGRGAWWTTVHHIAELGHDRATDSPTSTSMLSLGFTVLPLSTKHE